MTLVSERHSFKSGAKGAHVLPCELWPVSFTGMSKHYPIQYPRRTISRGVLAQGGVLGIFPKGGSWATLLRPPRPGLAYIAEQSSAPVVPISIIGAENVIGGPRRPLSIEFHPRLTAPVIMDKSGRREAPDAFGDEVMSVIAQGLPDAQRGKFSSDPGARQAALAASDFPFHSDEMRGG